MKIANKITYSFLSLNIIITALAVSFAYLTARDHLKEAIGARLETALNSRREHISTYLMMLKVSVGQLSKSEVLVNLLNIDKDDPRRKEAFAIAMRRLKRTKEANPSILEFLLLDSKGVVIASTDENSIGKDKSGDMLFSGAKMEVFIKDVYYNEALQKPLLAVSAPLINPQADDFIGVIAARVELRDLYDIVMARTGLGKTGEIYIVNRDGFMITPSRFIPGTFLKQKIDSPNFRDSQLHKGGRHLPEEEAIDVFKDYRGVTVLGMQEYIPQMHWALLGEIDLREAYAPLFTIRWLFLIILFIVPLITWLVGLLLARLIIRPIHKLHLGAEIIGKGNLDYKVDINSKDEVGQLAEAFDDMTQDLKKSRNELKGWAQNLEAKVKERTRELTDVQEATLNILEDLTEAKNKIEEAAKVKSDFTSMVSHELRTPLTAIKEGISIVSDGSAGVLSEEQKEFLDLAKRNVERLTRLINDVLDFQKLEAGSMAFNIQEHDINATVVDVHQMMLPAAQKKGLELVVKAGEDIPKIKFDRDKTIQVLMNLVNNAVKFTDRGSIAIITSKGENFIQVAVQDTGPGIIEEDLSKLFQKFVQLGGANERKTGGSGLGLAISKEIIEKQKGKIWAESKPGEGTTFFFLLPIHERRV